ncbi:transporter substrate-binding domain-containing protein [Microvirga lenta]|uniref:transporter substrate-binding domain-containing protein n=1 Tax=Microvirga lenta TaxID=2881337 RepID=UPI001CFFE286|nr:transporter substrate-binding domain-containing protein [Microvirga lenta]MCB5176225.1 transporter substrate-binding domain-containing protein [Microvirga lenta]
MNLLNFGRKLALVALAAVLGAGPPAMAQDRPVIRVAVEGAYPPFNYIENNELQGFEVDLLKALCEVMKVLCVPVAHQWDGIVRGLLNREYDAIMSSLEINERRKKRIAFSIPYYRIPAIFIGPKETPAGQVSPEALAGKKIGTADRSDHETYLKEFYRESEIELYGKTDEANLDLLVGRLDAVFGDKRFLTRFLESREGSCCHVLGDAPANPAYRHQSYGIGLRQEDTALKAQFDSAIAQVMADGTYDRIRAKYFPFDIK